ncbi:MAG: zinc ribbon domain-containing protein [Candidatus Riflebacteria bacterium]|nr:zinc ribbon domain-containing protein [Candidatus Riflebacteria bacterium]
MPIYEFICANCQKSFDLLLSIRTDLSTVSCTHCSGKNVSKKVSNFATGGGSKSFDLSEPSDGGHSHSHGGGCGSCGTHSCGTCSH